MSSNSPLHRLVGVAVVEMTAVAVEAGCVAGTGVRVGLAAGVRGCASASTPAHAAIKNVPTAIRTGSAEDRDLQDFIVAPYR
jgi:hypothetical protein